MSPVAFKGQKHATYDADGTLRLDPLARQILATRLMLQAPQGLTPKQIANVARDLDRRIRGLPPGAFMALDALRLLADQGNSTAAWLLELESKKLGLTQPFASYVRDGRNRL